MPFPWDDGLGFDECRWHRQDAAHRHRPREEPHAESPHVLKHFLCGAMVLQEGQDFGRVRARLARRIGASTGWRPRLCARSHADELRCLLEVHEDDLHQPLHHAMQGAHLQELSRKCIMPFLHRSNDNLVEFRLATFPPQILEPIPEK